IAPLGYQWGSLFYIPDATNSSYTITNVQFRDGGNYWVSVTNGMGMTNSSNALLTVVLAPRTVAGWGDDFNGQSTVPSTLNGVKAIAAGASHSVAVRTNGTVFCWGDNTYGQTNLPSGASNVVAVSAGYYTTLALRGDGTLAAWGSA